MKYIFDTHKLKDYYVGDDNAVYRKGFMSHGKYYKAKRIKKQYGNRYRLNGEWWSERQLIGLIKEP